LGRSFRADLRQLFGPDESVVRILVFFLPLTDKVAEMRPVVLFAFVQRLRDLEVDPRSGLLDRRLEGSQGIAAEAGVEQATLAQPVEVLEHFLEVPIQVEQSFIREHF
jgi:hypothetical protein